MTSTMLAGEKRWASARRGGMTVLGKVTAPKPLNLPSQRLENHGLDPNVEIVPKGTLSWGSRSSSSTSSAWGSSTLSPNADGTSSPSHLSGRPSSGSGTRPSTAGSDRTHESTPNAWGQSSRPSSASGALTTNQTSLTVLRPRSADTRPGSSHLSRFAEPSSENSVAWGPTGVSEKLGMISSKNDGFSLSSGDFPTLGTEREYSGKSTDSQDHGSYSRPGSSSGRAALGKTTTVTSSAGGISVNTNVKSGTVNTCRRDDSQRVEDGVQPAVEKWQGEPPLYLNANVPPQHFDLWHGLPINPPGVWYGGPPVGPPYQTPLAPGGFPIEPFPYYHPQIPPNSQPVPPPGTGPRGHHPKNGDLYRPHIPDAYIRPSMPIRPGFYPGPAGYEGYYGPPMGYCNSNERDIPLMGMAARSSVYNRNPGENAPDPGHNHARAGVHGSTGKTPASEQVGSGHPGDTRGPYKVLLKQHNEWDEKQVEDKWEHVVPANAPHLEKGDQPRTSVQKNEWGLEDIKDEEFYSGRRDIGGDARYRGTCSSDSVKVKLPESRGKLKSDDDSSVNKSDNVASTFPRVPQLFPATPKDPTLIQKVEGLNAKAWASDGRSDVGSSICCREEQNSRLQVVDAMANHSANEAGTGVVCFERTHASGNLIPSSHEVDISTSDETLQPAASRGTAISRRASHGVQGRLDDHGKRFNTHDADGWRKKRPAIESISEVSAANSEPSFNVHVQDRLTSVEVAEKSGISLQGKDEGESLTLMFDVSDCQAQRAKMRDIAKQRAKQLQEEEEERIREQKAKALAKFEELNRRTQTMDGSTQKLETALPSGPIQREREESSIPAEPVMDASKSETPSSALVSNPNTLLRESGSIGVGEFTILFKDGLLETSDNVHTESVISHVQPLPLQQDAHTAGATDCKAAAQVSEGSVYRHKPIGYKQKQNIPLGKNLTEKSVPICPTEAPKDHTGVVVNDIASTEVVAGEIGSGCESSLPMNSNIMAESSAHQRKKNNRSSKIKHKLDDVSSIAVLPSAVSKETNAAKVSTESGKPKASELELDPSSVQSRTVAKHAIQPPEQRRFLPGEEADGKVNNQWRSQHSRRMPRNQQARMAEKLYSSDAVIWAPVRSQNKAELMDEADNKSLPDTVIETAKTEKSDNVVQNNMKSKRAEMERYVPKPVAKELAQQGSMQQLVPPSVNQTTSDDTGGRAEPFQKVESTQPGNLAIGNIGATAESRNGDGKQNKQSKAHGSWCQRDSVESVFVQGLQHGSSSTSDTGKNVQKSIEQYQSLKPDINSLKDQTKSSDDWNTSDGWNTPDNYETAAPVTSAVAKYQGVTGQGKRHPFKGHRSMGNNHDHRNANIGDIDKSSSQPPAPEMGQTDKNISSKENRGVGERTSSHWQPKSQVYSAHNRHGNRPTGGQNASAEVSNAIKKDSPSQDRVHLPAQYNKESRENVVQPPIDQSQSEQKNVAETLKVGHQESKRERKVASFRGRPHSPDLSSVNTVEMAPPSSVDTQHEQHFSSGFDKNGNQNNRSGRGHESRGDWSSAEQDNRQHNTSSNRQRQRHDPHYEYQPIGQYNKIKSNNFEGPTDGSQNMGSRYRERSQANSRRGGGSFYGRQS